MLIIEIILTSFGISLALSFISFLVYERFNKYRSQLVDKKRYALAISKLAYSSFVLQKEAFDAYKALLKVSMETSKPSQHNVNHELVKYTKQAKIPL